MDQVKTCAAVSPNSSGVSSPAVCLVVLSAILRASTVPPRVHAITINMTYSNEGDPVPHDENPTWDPDGSILKNHFQAAKTIWETLLPGPGSYDFDFQWDDDLDSNELGLTTPLGPLGTTIELNSTKNWFADSTPNENGEFLTTPVQSVYGDLSASDKATYFPVANPPDTLETKFDLTGKIGAVGLGGYDSHDGYDMLTVILHEMGHVLAINNILPGDWPIDPQHVGGISDVWVLGTFAVPGGPHLAGDVNVPGFLMNPATPPNVRILPSATDVLVVADDQNISQVHLARVGRISDGAWNTDNGWIGGAVPDATQDVYLRTSDVTLDVNANVKSLKLGTTSTIHAQNHRLTVQGTLDADAAHLTVDAGGTIEADKLVSYDLICQCRIGRSIQQFRARPDFGRHVRELRRQRGNWIQRGLRAFGNVRPY